MHMESQGNQSVDSVFGQTPAFALTDERVDPAVVRYLHNVRQEALRTNVITVPKAKRHTADIYDEEETVVRKAKRVERPPESSESLKNLPAEMANWIKWFERTKQLLLEDGDVPQQHTEHTMNLLLHYLKQYLAGHHEQKGYVLHLISVLQDHPDVEDDDAFELDEKWADSVLKRLRNREIKGIDDIKSVISNADFSRPRGFKEWYQYMQENEPTQAAFKTIVNRGSIWILVQYMTQEWIKLISKCKKLPQATRFSNWLLYILFNLPDNLTAAYISNLRNLGKKCQKIIENEAGANGESADVRRAPSLRSSLPTELVKLEVPLPPEGLNIIQLTLAIVAKTYRQIDLIEFTGSL